VAEDTPVREGEALERHDRNGEGSQLQLREEFDDSESRRDMEIEPAPEEEDDDDCGLEVVMSQAGEEER
jgi:hypothetical protein